MLLFFVLCGFIPCRYGTTCESTNKYDWLGPGIYVSIPHRYGTTTENWLFLELILAQNPRFCKIFGKKVGQPQKGRILESTEISSFFKNEYFSQILDRLFSLKCVFFACFWPIFLSSKYCKRLFYRDLEVDRLFSTSNIPKPWAFLLPSPVW